MERPVPVNNSLGDEETVEALARLVREWGRERVRPFVQEREAAGEFPRDLYAEMGELGFFGCVFDESLGGTDVGFAALAAVAEQLAWVYPPLSAAMNLQAATVPLTIANWGDPDVIARWVPDLVAGRAGTATPAHRFPGTAALLGRRAHLCLAGPLSSLEQGRRGLTGHRGSVDLPRHEQPHARPVGRMTLFSHSLTAAGR